MKNWKKAFLWLAGVNGIILLLIIVLFIWLAALPENKAPSSDLVKLTPTDPVFTVSSNKAQLTKLINQEINDHPTGNLVFHVEMTDTADIVGNLNVLGIKVPFEISFSPYVRNGDIELKEESAKLGTFSLPESQVLKFIGAGGNLPDWVEVIPSKKQINVQLSHFLISDQLYFKAKTIDLANDDISFNVYKAPLEK